MTSKSTLKVRLPNFKVLIWELQKLYEILNVSTIVGSDKIKYNCTQCALPVNYPSYLSLTKNILTNNSINFLDLKIILKNKLLSIDIYDKRKDFNFKVNMFTNFNSCMHLSVYRNILLNHLFHIKKLS